MKQKLRVVKETPPKEQWLEMWTHHCWIENAVLIECIFLLNTGEKVKYYSRKFFDSAEEAREYALYLADLGRMATGPEGVSITRRLYKHEV